jgi:hypothetical protein
MSEATNLSIKIAGGSSNDSGNAQRVITLDRIKEWIDTLPYDDYTKKGLIELASRYPTAALPSFKKNFNVMVQRVFKKRREEMIGAENGSGEEEVDSKEA